LKRKIKVLFVYKGEGKNKINPVIDAQISSLQNDSLEIIKFPIKTKGIKSYFKCAFLLRKYSLNHNFDIVHAHYSYCGFISIVAKKPIICSLMGSDIFRQNTLIILATKFFSRFVWKATIVKSKEMSLKIKNSNIIPNGVNRNIFKPLDKDKARAKVGFQNKYNILFVANNPKSHVKNLALAEDAIKKLDNKKIKLNILSKVKQNELVHYYNAADLLLLTSLTEGSPNVVKEAIACNCPVVSTDVGDVKEIVGDIENCYVTGFSTNQVWSKIKKSMTDKQVKINHLIENYDSVKISKKIIDLYKKTLNNN
tara:strand:- start:17653 stop:18582 length:930 start_codon:yes stop_codon:yes gene_type:complete